ncbi:MAG: carbon-nitrogen hydrolase family protein [Methylocystaceae bacterium]
MQDFKLGLCQLQVTASKEENLARAFRQLRLTAARGAKIAVLPEMFTCPYNQSYFTTFAEDMNGSTMKMLAAAAQELNIFIIGGSFPLAESGRLYNYSPVFNPAGILIANHRKIHLFDIDLPEIRFMESETMAPGHEITVFTTPWATFGLGICYDIRFPELARLMVDAGAEVLVYPAAFGLVTGRLHWDLTLRARAVDNQVYTVGVGPAPNQDLPYISYGHSLVCDPMGRPIKKLGSKPSTSVIQLSSKAVSDARANQPLLKHRRHDLYRLISPKIE